MKKETGIELRSEKVRSLLGEIPSPFFKMGNSDNSCHHLSFIISYLYHTLS